MDEQGTPVPTEDRRIFIEISNGNFIGESPVHLEGGRIAFYAQTRKGWTLPITIRVIADGLEASPTLEVKVQFRKNPLVPLSDFDADGLATLH